MDPRGRNHEINDPDPGPVINTVASDNFLIWYLIGFACHDSYSSTGSPSSSWMRVLSSGSP